MKNVTFGDQTHQQRAQLSARKHRNALAVLASGIDDDQLTPEELNIIDTLEARDDFSKEPSCIEVKNRFPGYNKLFTAEHVVAAIIEDLQQRESKDGWTERVLTYTLFDYFQNTYRMEFNGESLYEFIDNLWDSHVGVFRYKCKFEENRQAFQWLRDAYESARRAEDDYMLELMTPSDHGW